MRGPHKTAGRVLIVTAGSSDAGVAREALHTLEACGVGGELLNDVGVAGIERLFASLDKLRAADVCIVVAGMEGALPSVVGAWSAARSSRCRPASATARRSAGSRRCSAC